MALLSPERGHFLLESGHHGNLWMDLEALFLDPNRIEPLADELSARLAKHNAEAICGPLVEGAFLALMVAQRMRLPFTYSERFEATDSGGLYPFVYRVPRTLHRHVHAKRIAIVTDVINAGSAVRGTTESLRQCGAQPIAIGALLILGDWTTAFAAQSSMAVESLASLPNDLWAPAECPLCAADVPLERRIQSI
ncbi:MAG: orotate phosphoribosyltransferase [Thermoanaerobaculia bacterium]|nr:orotate phosphoribosyltransferase [Thermoanaerobaculia bacterium]